MKLSRLIEKTERFTSETNPRQLSEQELVLRLAAATLPFIIRDRVYENMSQDSPEYEELLQVGMIGILKAVRSWKPDGGRTLQSWASYLANQAIIKFRQRENKHSSVITYIPGPEFFGDASESADDDNYNLQYPDTIEGESSGIGERAMVWDAEYSKVKQKLTYIEQDVLDLLRENNSQHEIAEILGASQSTVSRIVAKIQQKAKQLL